MKIKQYIALAALTMPLAASAQSVIDFETSATQGASVSVFDTWENSPFRTGKLNGNIKVIDNPFKVVDEITGNGNKSDKVLAFQRSRFGSSTFGARVELAEPLALTPKTQYVHVKIYTPKAEKIMLFALGKRADRTDQSKDVVQVEANCISSIKANKWYDAVFAISSAPGVNIHSFLIIPDLQSTHNLAQDFAVYVDDIEVNNTSMPSIQYGVYPTSYDKTTKKVQDWRYTSGVNFKSSDGQQSLSTNQQSDKLIFQDLLASSLKAKAGDEITTSVNYQGGWMNAYVYLDRDNNGKFDYTLNEQGTPDEKSDIMSFSHYQGKNSKGEAKVGDNRNTTSLPNFTIPADLEPGFYRLRYKVDWDCIDPAGNTSKENPITQNSGAIIDTRLNVHGEKVSIWRGQHTEGTNGEMLTTDGKNFEKHEIAFGKDYTVKFKPGDGFKVGKIYLRHGYNLEKDSLVNETPQYTDVVLPAYMVKDNTLTIPAEYIDGDVRVTPTFVTIKDEVTEKYALNFEKDLQNSHAKRYLNEVSFNTTTHANAQKIIPTNKKLVYQDFTTRNIYVKNGDVITTNINYNPESLKWMHAYLYVDLDGDGVFNTSVNADGTPAFDGEMLSYVYANGKNSKGENKTANEASSVSWPSTNSIPQFKLPIGLPKGEYRARLKIDWDCTDPAGRYGSKYDANFINENGGYVVDFYFNVVDEYPKFKLDVQTTNGSIVGAGNTGLPETILLDSPISVMAFGAAENYNATEIKVRHGKNLDGEAVVNGETQWKEESIELTDGACTIPAEMVDGDVRLTAEFEDAGAEYKLAFGDEFNTADFTQPNEAHWSRSEWADPTWKRFTAQTKAGQEKTGWIEDGKLVLRCVKNEFDDEKRGDNGSKLEMISGAVESADKITFTYGKVEGRLKTTAHSGNFPAFWMMPNKSTYGWPDSGEIDIFEQINNENTSYHTIHSHWANGAGDGGLGHGGNPQKGGTSATTTGDYHVYGLEWTENMLTWFVNGKKVFSYAKSTNQDDLDKKQWPFDKPFYLILNQSVGNGGWAANPDLNFTYETKFDWVRVYQKADGDLLTGINTAKEATLDYYVTPGQIRLVAPYSTKVTIVDLQGRTLFAQVVQGNKNVHVPSGVYLVNNNKVIVP